MKRKLLFIIFAFMFILLIFCNNSFASTEIEVNGTTFIMPDWWSSKEYKLFVKYDSTFYIISSNSPLFLISESNRYRIKNSDGTNLGYSTSSGTNIPSDLSGCTPYYDASSIKLFYLDNTNFYYYSSHDIYYGETLVFQAPVQETQEITLAQVLEKEKENNPQMIMKEILIILPTILVVVVSYLGLRKALAMLSAILHRS